MERFFLGCSVLRRRSEFPCFSRRSGFKGGLVVMFAVMVVMGFLQCWFTAVSWDEGVLCSDNGYGSGGELIWKVSRCSVAPAVVSVLYRVTVTSSRLRRLFSLSSPLIIENWFGEDSSPTAEAKQVLVTILVVVESALQRFFRTLFESLMVFSDNFSGGSLLDDEFGGISLLR
ncbi:hypothetical protein A2U01_0000418 [Trifolium medium]|uniref:Uncharacterized protein n=1 Tax=Trifolium medium TaxID=97028 RepID=A0A392LXR6_9FABA|nr:hypothetical protein [Trifolium medium]